MEVASDIVEVHILLNRFPPESEHWLLLLIEQWCRKYCTGWYRITLDSTLGRITVFFFEPKDAILFKLSPDSHQDS